MVSAIAPPILHLHVTTPQGASGALVRSENARYLFTYLPDCPRAAEVSLLMPQRAEPYVGNELHPVFQMNLPEGYVLDQLRLRLAKATPLDPMLLLALTGREAAIGRLRVDSSTLASYGDLAAPVDSRGERLQEILAWEGAEDLFAELARRYIFRTGISGIQPKLLVPEAAELPTPGKVALPASDLIVKSGGAEYPGLAVNEYLCMSVAREAGLPVPEFHLSRNRQLFVMRRFDRDADGQPIGFEDMAVLMGKGTAAKYDGSYEHVARAVELFCSPESRSTALGQLFDQVALSCILGNGDAHLKNFGVLYTDPTCDDVRLAPAYDLVNTTAYFPDDTLALTLGGSKSLFASRLHLLDFAGRCGVDDPKPRIVELLAATERILARERALLETEPQVRRALVHSVERFAGSFR